MAFTSVKSSSQNGVAPPEELCFCTKYGKGHFIFAAITLIGIIGTIIAGVIALSSPNLVPMPYSMVACLAPIGVILIGAFGVGFSCLCAYRNVEKADESVQQGGDNTPIHNEDPPVEETHDSIEQTPSILSKPENQEKIRAANNNDSTKAGPLGLICDAARQLSLSDETQEHLSKFVKGIRSLVLPSATHKETPANLQLLLRQFAEVFSLIQEKDDDQQTLLRNYLMELETAYLDNKSADGISAICYPAISGLNLNHIRILQKPETQELKPALHFFWSEFKLQCIENMILDQRDLCVLSKTGAGEFYSAFESMQRTVFLTALYPFLAQFSQTPLTPATLIKNVMSSSQLANLLIIFPKKQNETERSYTERVHLLGQVPLQLMLWPMHDSNKKALAIELLKEKLKLEHLDLAVHNKQDLSGFAEHLLLVAPLWNSLVKYYFTSDRFVAYVKTWLEDSSFIQLKQKALNYVYQKDQDPQLFQGSDLSEKGIRLLLSSFQKGPPVFS